MPIKKSCFEKFCTVLCWAGHCSVTSSSNFMRKFHSLYLRDISSYWSFLVSYTNSLSRLKTHCFLLPHFLHCFFLPRLTIYTESSWYISILVINFTYKRFLLVQYLLLWCTTVNELFNVNQKRTFYNPTL